MRYDDMMDLDMYDDGMGEFMTMDMVRDQLLAASAGGGALMVASWLTPMLPVPEGWDGTAKGSRLRAAVAGVGGMLASRALWDYNRDAAMAVLGSVTGLAIAQIADSFFELDLLGGTPLGETPSDMALSEESLLSAYDNDGMAALRSLETTGVTSAPGAFADPTVTPEALMGTVVQAETLGQAGYNAYMM
jgi:hypothetical protein